MIDLKVRALHYGSNWNIADRNQDVIVVRDALVTTGQEKKQRQHTKLFDGWKW